MAWSANALSALILPLLGACLQGQDLTLNPGAPPPDRPAPLRLVPTACRLVPLGPVQALSSPFLGAARFVPTAWLAFIASAFATRAQFTARHGLPARNPSSAFQWAHIQAPHLRADLSAPLNRCQAPGYQFAHGTVRAPIEWRALACGCYPYNRDLLARLRISGATVLLVAVAGSLTGCTYPSAMHMYGLACLIRYGGCRPRLFSVSGQVFPCWFVRASPPLGGSGATGPLGVLVRRTSPRGSSLRRVSPGLTHHHCSPAAFASPRLRLTTPALAPGPASLPAMFALTVGWTWCAVQVLHALRSFRATHTVARFCELPSGTMVLRRARVFDSLRA